MKTENDGRNDFDFLIGTWKVHHRMLTQRLKGSTEWMEFDGDTTDRKIMNGLGNMDENIIHMETGQVHAISLRLFDPQSKEWSIHWSTDRMGTLDIPMIGASRMGVVNFMLRRSLKAGMSTTASFGQESQRIRVNGNRSFLRMVEKTWETNWIMVFERV